MKGKQTVIDALNQLLASELTAMDQYFIHSQMYDDWGLQKLHERIAHEFEDEKGHASLLIERILFLEGKPCMGKRDALNVGTDISSMLRSDLDVEYAVDAMLKETIALCEKEQDYQTRNMLNTLLEDTEMDHAYWLEKQLGLIDRIGIQNYTQSQMG